MLPRCKKLDRPPNHWLVGTIVRDCPMMDLCSSRMCPYSLLWSRRQSSSCSARPTSSRRGRSARSSPSWGSTTSRWGATRAGTPRRDFLESAFMYRWTKFFLANWMHRCTNSCQQASWRKVVLNHFEMFWFSNAYIWRTNSWPVAWRSLCACILLKTSMELPNSQIFFSVQVWFVA